MIRSFRCPETRRLFRREFSRRFRSIERAARRRLEYLDSVSTLAEMAAVPGYHLEALRGDRRGQHSIRVNDQWRICFTWKEGEAHDVEIVDYH